MSQKIRATLFVALAFGLSVPQLFAQQVGQRDPQALSILGQLLKAAGGVSALRSVQDFMGTGSVTFYWENVETGSVTVKGRGPGQYRMDSTLPEGVRTVFVNNGSGLIIETDGTVEGMTHRGALNFGSTVFPYLTTLAQFQDASVSITYLGLVNHLGSPAHDIRFQTTYSSQVDPTGLLSAQTARDVFVDPNTFLPVSILDQVNATSNGSGGIPHELVFANWQQVSGIAVPFWITESVGNQARVTIQLAQLMFNNNLPDTTFAP